MMFFQRQGYRFWLEHDLQSTLTLLFSYAVDPLVSPTAVFTQRQVGHLNRGLCRQPDIVTASAAMSTTGGWNRKWPQK